MNTSSPDNSLKAFEAWLEPILREVHDIYRHSFNQEPALTADGSLSFTGVDLDENTLQTIRNLGFQEAERVAQTIANWHRGNVRAMRTARARELLTELTPALLRAFSQTVDPDSAFQNFGRFMERLPAVVQLFSLFISNPQLMEMIAVIMGNAPGLAAHLARHPDWLDILLTIRLQETLDYQSPPPLPSEMSGHEEEWIEILSRFRNEREFLIGTEILKGRLDPLQANHLLTQTADAVLAAYIPAQRKRFEATYGAIAGSGMAILGLGRMGSRELCFGSDLDLVFLYDAADDQLLSDGEKPYAAMVYYNRLCQRLVGGLEATNAEGRLYAVDTRLRPAGKDSPLAISIDAFTQYFLNHAWTFEKMALMRHRVLYADPQIAPKIHQAITSIYQMPTDAMLLRKDASEMRERIAREHPKTDIWRVKHARGGLMDITFIAQILALTHATEYPEIVSANLLEILERASLKGLLSAQDHSQLLTAWQFQSRLASLLRLCQRDFSENTASKGLLNFLATSFSAPSYTLLRESLIAHQENVMRIYRKLIALRALG
jgi:glutamate-ammonia-ligase adenylyltransferase